MSRSRENSPFVGLWRYQSGKAHKQRAERSLRRINRMHVLFGSEPMNSSRSILDVLDHVCDGKRYRPEVPAK